MVRIGFTDIPKLGGGAALCPPPTSGVLKVVEQYFDWNKTCNFFFSNIIEVVDGRMLVFDPKEDREDFFYQGQKQQRRDLNKKENRDQKFAFDVVFGPNANNEDVYAGTVI